MKAVEVGNQFELLDHGSVLTEKILLLLCCTTQSAENYLVKLQRLVTREQLAQNGQAPG
jgi:hypothetical protein